MQGFSCWGWGPAIILLLFNIAFDPISFPISSQNISLIRLSHEQIPNVKGTGCLVTAPLNWWIQFVFKISCFNSFTTSHSAGFWQFLGSFFHIKVLAALNRIVSAGLNSEAGSCWSYSMCCIYYCCCLIAGKLHFCLSVWISQQFFLFHHPKHAHEVNCSPIQCLLVLVCVEPHSV